MTAERLPHPGVNEAGGPLQGEIRPFAVASEEGKESEKGTAEQAAWSYLDLDALKEKGIPPIPWIFPRWLAENDVALLVGPAYSGKSTTAAAMAIALAASLAWCGITSSGPMRVLFIDEEQGLQDTARLFLRLLAGYGLERAPEFLRVCTMQGANFTTEEGIAVLRREVKAHDAKVVIIDSVQHVFAGVDENSAEDVARVFREALFPLRDTGVAFVLIHHRKKVPPRGQVDSMDLPRGSTAYTTQSSTVWFANKAGPRSIELRQLKRRGTAPTSMRILYEDDGENGPIRLNGEGPVEEADGALAKAQTFLRDYMAAHRLSRPGELTEAGGREGHSDRTIKRALEQLSSLGVARQVRKRGPWELVIGPGVETEDPSLLEGDA